MINYILVFFIALSGLFGALSYHFNSAKAEAEQALVQVIDANTALEKSLNLRDLSCKIDDTSVVQVEADKKDLQTKIEAVSENIEKLRLPLGKTPVAAKQEIIKNENLKPNVLPDDGLLSDNIVSLLKQGYCTTYPNDNECISK